ncbi:MAG: amino acid ABC transporter permease [Alphaproteobacteria bacterium]|nr:amino acid ABC transporter permease [Alphaproteobacteria bacterium]
MRIDIAFIVDHLPLLWQGMQVTLLLTMLGIVLGIALGAVLAVARLSGVRPLAIAAAAYVDLFRLLPLLLIIFWVYFLLPLWLGRPIGGFYSALVSFVLYEAAYFSEIIRAGILGIRRGQINAGLASGLSYAGTMRHIVLPQALRNMLPVLLVQCINLFKSTSLVYVVGVNDFLMAADVVGTKDNRLIEMYVFVALVYFTLCFAAARAADRLQRRYAL